MQMNQKEYEAYNFNGEAYEALCRNTNTVWMKKYVGQSGFWLCHAW